MVGNINLPLGAVMRGTYSKTAVPEPGAPKAVESQQDPFSQQLFAALAGSLDKLGLDGQGIQITVRPGQDSGAAAGSRQYVITVEKLGAGTPAASASAAASPAAASPAVPAAGAAAAPPKSQAQAPEAATLPPIGFTYGSVFDMEDPIPQLVETMKSMGIDPSGISFSLLDDAAVGITSAGNVNHIIRARLANGWQQDFSVEWTQRNPRVTAVEIAALKRRPDPPPHLVGV